MNLICRLVLIITCLAMPASTLAAETENAADTANSTLVWPDGTRYVGEVKDGKRWGKGTIFWQDGTRFVGNFVEDKRNGPGTMILPDGTVYNGYFENDSLVEAPSKPVPARRIASSEPAAPVVEINAPDDTPAAAVVEVEPEPVIAAATPAVSVQPTPPPPQPMLDPEITELNETVRKEIEAMIDLWAAAWSEQNVVQYLDYYSEDFDVPGRQSRRQWEGLRRSRLTRPSSINVKVAFQKFELVRPNVVQVQFEQSYQSNLYRDKTNKQMVVQKEGQFWRILSETSR